MAYALSAPTGSARRREDHHFPRSSRPPGCDARPMEGKITNPNAGRADQVDLASIYRAKTMEETFVALHPKGRMGRQILE